MNLDNQRYEKIKRILKPYYKNKDFELNYLVRDYEEVSIFISINECEKLPDEAIQQIASALDGVFKGYNLINQEYRYSFILNPCGK